MERIDVLVVGAGPTGLSLAALLARAGVDVRVCDATPDGSRESSRATSVHASTLAQLDLLDRAGHDVASQAVRAHGSTLWHGRGRIAQVHYDRLPGPYPLMANLPQRQTEAVLRDRLTATGHDVEWGWKLDSLDAGQTTATARLRGDEGERRVLARYVVGCDGAHSTVRRMLESEMEGHTHPERFLLADARLRTGLDPEQTHVFVSTRGVLGVMPMPDGSFRLNGTLADDEDATPDALPGLMAARLGRAADNVTLDDVGWSATYQTHSRCARRYRVNSVFVAGDAAHLVSPVGGQGMNLGIQDAINLGWKLAAVLRRAAPAALLDTYEEERRPVAQLTMRMSERMTRMFTARRRVERTLRNTALRLGHRFPPVQRQLTWVPAGLLQTYTSTAVAASTPKRAGVKPGHLLTATAPTATRLTNLDAIGAILLTGDRPPSALARMAREFGLPVESSDLARLGDATAVLVRPDGFIGWVGEDADSLRAYLTATLGRAMSTKSHR